MVGVVPWLVVLLVDGVGGEYFGVGGRNGVVEYHNQIRSQLAKGDFISRGNRRKPTGSNILKMVWNQSLAESAENYARKNPKTHSMKPGVGENLYWHWSTNPGEMGRYGSMAAESWINEFKNLDWEDTVLSQKLFSSGVGHATQMVWATTNQVGCGYSQFSEIHQPTHRSISKIVVVCHYYPKGNYLNEPIYDVGPACSKCTKCEYTSSLCT